MNINTSITIKIDLFLNDNFLYIQISNLLLS